MPALEIESKSNLNLVIGNENENDSDNDHDNVATRTGVRSNQNWAHTILINRLRLPNRAEQSRQNGGRVLANKHTLSNSHARKASAPTEGLTKSCVCCRCIKRVGSAASNSRSLSTLSFNPLYSTIESRLQQNTLQPYNWISAYLYCNNNL